MGEEVQPFTPSTFACENEESQLGPFHSIWPTTTCQHVKLFDLFVKPHI